jgi:cold shock CspA family protein
MQSIGVDMRFEGTLTAWNAERGYGSITPQQGGQALFVHISAFPVDSAPPTPGEALSFEVVTGHDENKRAARVQRAKQRVAVEQRALATRVSQRRGRFAQRRRRVAGSLLALLLAVGAVGWLHLTAPTGQALALLQATTLR